MSTMSKLRMVFAVSACAMIPIVAQTAPAPTLPGEGKGKELVQDVCTACHGLNQIMNSSGYSKEHWQELISNMVDLSSSTQQRDQIVGYLAQNFPPNNKRKAVEVKGDLKINIQEWKVPTLGQAAGR